MPDEITPEQWRAWREEPCTKRLVEKMEAEALWYEEIAQRHRLGAISMLDRGGSDLEQERLLSKEARISAGTIREWLRGIAMAEKMTPPVKDPVGANGRVTVQG